MRSRDWTAQSHSATVTNAYAYPIFIKTRDKRSRRDTSVCLSVSGVWHVSERVSVPGDPGLNVLPWHGSPLENQKGLSLSQSGESGPPKPPKNVARKNGGLPVLQPVSKSPNGKIDGATRWAPERWGPRLGKWVRQLSKKQILHGSGCFFFGRSTGKASRCSGGWVVSVGIRVGADQQAHATGIGPDETADAGRRKAGKKPTQQSSKGWCKNKTRCCAYLTAVPTKENTCECHSCLFE